MKILVVGLVENPQVDRLWEEGYKRGHNVVACYTSELTVFADGESFNVSLRHKDITDFDLIYLWVIGKKRWEWIAACRYLYEKFGIVIVNKAYVENFPRGFNPSFISDLFLQSHAKIPFPKTAVILSRRSIESVIKNFSFPVIVKSGASRKGKWVYKANSKGELVEMVEAIEKEELLPIVIREFIPNDGDIRVFTVGFKAVAAMKRIPVEGEFRSNISLGARGEKINLGQYPELVKIAEGASRELGIEVAGVDIIVHKESGKPYLLEVNSGPQILGIEKYTKVNVAGKIIEYFEKKVSEKKGS